MNLPGFPLMVTSTSGWLCSNVTGSSSILSRRHAEASAARALPAPNAIVAAAMAAKTVLIDLAPRRSIVYSPVTTFRAPIFHG